MPPQLRTRKTKQQNPNPNQNPNPIAKPEPATRGRRGRPARNRNNNTIAAAAARDQVQEQQQQQQPQNEQPHVPEQIRVSNKQENMDDDCDSGGGRTAADKGPVAEDEGSTPPIPEKVNFFFFLFLSITIF